jgi:hypothetical protein
VPRRSTSVHVNLRRRGAGAHALGAAHAACARTRGCRVRPSALRAAQRAWRC